MFYSKKKIAKKAASWFARSRTKNFTPAEQARLDAWLAASSRHLAAYQQICRVWERSGQLDPAAVERLRPARLRPAVRWWTPFQLAGFGFACLFVVAFVFFQTELNELYVSLKGEQHLYYTRPGQVHKIVLRDGSRLEVNGNTSVTVYQDRWNRRLDMQEGEIFLQVTPDAKRPFIVNTRSGQIKVLGTCFHVCSRNGQVGVNVQQGRVQVQASPPSLGIVGSKEILLAGQGVDYSWAGKMSKPRKAEPQEVLAWREGKIIFRSTRLADVVQKLQTSHQLKIVLPPQLLDERFTGTFSTQDVNEIVRTIKLLFGLTSQELADGTLFLSL